MKQDLFLTQNKNLTRVPFLMVRDFLFLMAKKELRPIDKVIDEYSQFHSHPTNKLIQYITIPLILFSLLGLIWAIPFPHLDFIGKYNGFVNWASFVIAFSIYYYYRLSPVLSYGVLLLVFALSAGIVTLEKLHSTNNWPEMWQVCLGVLIPVILLQYLGYRGEKAFPSIVQSLRNILISPLWLFYTIFKKAGLKV